MKGFINVALILPKVNVATPPVSSKKRDNWHYGAWAIVGLGILLRLIHFLHNRSLWIDEIYLSTSLIKMNFRELMAPMLDFEQKAPIPFLWLARASVLLFGKNEMALRLFPLLCGFASLILFLPVARYFLKPLGVVVALGMLALAPPLIFHAVEIKQYSTELLATIVALNLYIRYHRRQDIKSLLLWGLGGAVVLWFSFSSIFILAGIAIGSSLYYLFKKDWTALFRSVIPFSMWLIMFATHFLLFTAKHLKSAWLVDWFQHQEAFMPFPPTALHDLVWFFQLPYRFMNYPMGLLWFSPDVSSNTLIRLVFRMLPLFVLVFVVGMFLFYKYSKRTLLILIIPFLLTLLASGLKVYPFYERLLVFLAPLAIILMAQGCEYLTNLFPARAKWRFLLPALLLAGPLLNSLAQVLNPDLMDTAQSKGMAIQHHRETFQYINDRYQPGDAVYVYWNDLPPYRFYKNINNLKFTAIEGRDVRFISKDMTEYFKNLAPDFKALAGKKRVWLVYDRLLNLNIGDFYGQPAYYYNACLLQPGKMFIHNKFAEMGKEIDTYQTPYLNVSLFLLDAK